MTRQELDKQMMQVWHECCAKVGLRSGKKKAIATIIVEWHFPGEDSLLMRFPFEARGKIKLERKIQKFKEKFKPDQMWVFNNCSIQSSGQMYKVLAWGVMEKFAQTMENLASKIKQKEDYERTRRLD